MNVEMLAQEEAKAKAEVITLKEQIGSMVEESESALANQQKSRSLRTANLKLAAEKKILVSRCNNLEAQLKNASSSESDFRKVKKGNRSAEAAYERYGRRSQRKRQGA